VANPWDNDPVVQQGPVLGPPRLPSPQTGPQAQQDALQVDKLRQDIQTHPLEVESKQVGIEQNRQSMQNQRFNQNQGLRQEFNALPEVKNYSAAVQSLGTALKAPDTPQGDLAVIYAYAKAADPGSVVREGEMDMATATASLPEKYRAEVGKLTEGKRLPPEVRLGLIETMRQSVSGMRQVYDQQRERYSSLAQQNGFDPQQIVGEPLYSAYRPAEEAYITAHGGVPRDPYAPDTQPIVPGVQEAPPPKFGDAGTTVQFNDEAEGRTRAQQFHDNLYNALSSKQLKSPADVNAWVQQFNQQNSSNFQINWKDPDTRKAIGAALRGQKFGVETPIDPAVLKRQQEIAANDKLGGGRASSTAAGAVDALSVGADNKIAAGISAVDQALQGRGSVGDLYNVNLSADRAREDQLQQQHPGFYLGGQIGGSLLLPAGEARTPAQLAKVGAAYGGAYGFNNSRGSYTDAAANALLGAGTGAAVGYAIPKGFSLAKNALSRAPEAVPPLVDPQTGQLNQPLEAMTPGQRVVKAEEYGINLPADAAGGRTAAVIGKGLDIMPGSAGVMEDARRATESQVAAASDVVASRFGNARTMNEAGAELQRGASERIERGKTVIGKAYDAIPISDQAPAATNNSIATLQNLTSRFQSNPDLAATLKDPKLAGYLDALQKGGLSWKDLKDFRSIIGEKIGEMRFGESSSTSDLRALYAGLSEDMQTTAAQMGPRATAAFNRANNLNRENEQLIQGALTRILGKDGQLAPEKAAAAVQAMTKGGKSTGDLKTLAQIRSATIKSGAWNEIASTLIRLGGQPANSAGRDFNPQTFVHWYADMAEPARRMLFGKSELRDALDGFVAVNQRLQKVNALRNTSNTAGNLTAAGTVGTMAASIGSPLLGAKLLGVMAGNYGMAKAWTNPAFVRLMTGYSKAVASGNLQAVQSQIGRIGKLAATNPDLREPLEALLKRVANDNVVPEVAASTNADSGNNDQQRQ
jgi:hypothetical protein